MNLEGNFEKDMERLSEEKKEYHEYIAGEPAKITEWHETSPEEELQNNLNTYQTLAKLQKIGENVTEAIAFNDISFENNLAKLEAKPEVSKELVEEYRNKRNSIIKQINESNHIRTI